MSPYTVTPKTASEILGVPVARVMALCRSGELVGYRRGGELTALEYVHVKDYAARIGRPVSPPSRELSPAVLDSWQEIRRGIRRAFG
jgi:hypothetical protein